MELHATVAALFVSDVIHFRSAMLKDHWSVILFIKGFEPDWLLIKIHYRLYKSAGL